MRLRGSRSDDRMIEASSTVVVPAEGEEQRTLEVKREGASFAGLSPT